MSTGTIQIPVLFDMSGGSVVYGEDATGADFVDSHLQFLLDMTTEANGISLNASDISSAILVADQDTGDNIFFDGDATGQGIDNLCNRIAKTITRGKLVHIPSIGNFSNSGIPVGGEKYLYNNLGQIQDPGTYTLKYKSSIAPIGDEQMLGQAMARVASVHLIGDPLGSAAFEDATSIQTNLETASSQTFNQGMSTFYNALAVQLSKVLGGSKSSTPMNPGILVGTEQYSTPFDLVTTSLIPDTNPGSPLTGQVYTASSENNTSTYAAARAFNTTYNTHWMSAGATYTNGTGMPATSTLMGNINNVTTNSNVWNGMWIKADLGETVVLSEYKIYPYQHNNYGSAPRHGYFLSSPDGINWFQIHELDITDDAAGRLLYKDANNNYIPVTIDLTALNHREGRYFALVIDKIFSSAGLNYCIIKELQLNGVTKAEFDGGSPPAAYDVGSGKANSAYSASSNYHATVYRPYEAFNGDTGTGYGWLSLNNSFFRTTGELNNASTHKLQSGIIGEWIQVDLSQNVNVMKMHLIGAGDGKDYPMEGYLLSSKDKINWDIVHTLNSTNWVEGTSFDDYIVDLTGTPTGEDDIKIGSSWRLLITKTTTTNNGYLRLYSFQLNGIVFPTDFGSTPSTSNEIFTNNVTSYDITSWNNETMVNHSVITDQHYSSSSRSNTTSYSHESAFKDDVVSNWRSLSSLYNITDGLHQHNTWTGPYRGEWIQVDLSENFLVKNYLIDGYKSTHLPYVKSSPKKGYLLSSLDNKRWRLAHTFDISSNDAREYYNTTDQYGSIYNDISNNELSVGRYWRFVIEKVFPTNSGYVNIRNFKLFGVKESEETKTNGQSTTSFINDYTLTVTPYDLTSNNQVDNKNTVSDLSGVYSSSSFYSASHPPYYAFEETVATMWKSHVNDYNTTAGTYSGNHATGPYRGEWIQVDVGETVFADNYIIGGYILGGGHEPYHASSPKKGYLLSSLDGKKWRLAHTFEETTDAAEYVYTTNNGLGVAYRDISNNENAIGRYWRFVIEKVFQSQSEGPTISKLKINGGRFPSQVTQGDITNTTQDNTIYTLNTTPYDLTTHTITGAEASWGTFNPPSDLSGVYSSSSYADANQLPKEAFTTAENTYAWRSLSSVYNVTQGTYYGAHMTGPYKGEWIQVDVGETVFADNYLIGGYKSTHIPYTNSSPKKGYLLSSLDGKTWRLAHTFDETTDAAEYAYNDTSGNGVRINNITNNKNAIGRYWRFVIEKVFASNSAYVHMTQFKIDGVKYPSEVNVGNGAETTTIRNYTLTETGYDFSSVDNAGVSLIQLPVRSENLNNRFSSSSYESASYLPKQAFAGYSNYDWRCYGTPYNAGSGLYYGVHATGPYKGEWIQVDLSENYIASSYVLQGFPSNYAPYHDSSPKKGYLLSSLDGKTWRLAHTFDETTDAADYTYTTTNFNGIKYNEITCNDYAIGRYWRFVVEKVFAGNDGYVNIRMLTLYGVKESQKIEGIISKDISNNNPGYVFNVTPYDITNEFSVLTGHEYSASSVHTATTYDPNKTFLNLTGDTWRSLTQYNSASGTYYGTKFTGPYKGEWIQVDLSENIFADSYRIGGFPYDSNYAPYLGSSPKKGYLLSSLDGKTWRLVHTFEETTYDYAWSSTNGRGSSYNDISNNENAIGRYWRFVVEELFSTNSSYVAISQFTIMGVKYTSEVTVQNVAVDPSLNIVRNLPADMTTIYDLVSSASTITGQTYISSTHVSATYEPVKSFDNDTATMWRSIENQYNGATGTYYGNKSTGKYYGEWIQVDVGENVVIGQYKIHPWYHTHGTYFNTSVKKAFLLSSLDANKWELVHSFEVADTSAYNYSGSTSTMTPVTTSLNGTSCKGRYFRLVVNQIFPSNEGEVNISQFEILGVKESEETISAESKVPSYNTFTNSAIPYDIYRRALAHTTTPYLISTEVSSLVPIDIASQNSTISGQSYSATYGTAGNAFDNSGNTEWSTDASSNYGIISSLITNEPNFSSWAAVADGVTTTFSENITVDTIDKSNFSIYDTSSNSIVPIHSVEISNGELLVRPLNGYQYNTNVAEYDLTSTASTLFGTRGDITYTSQYANNGHIWSIAFDDTMNGPALFASGSWSGRNPVGGVDFVIDGVTYHGHWVQLDVGQNVLVKTFEYTPRNNYQSNEWDTLLIAGSKDGTTWDLLWRETERTQSTAQVKETYAVNATDVYSQFRWLCEKTTGSAGYAFNALEITLLGQKESEASLIAFTASKINDYRITYSKPLNQDNQLKGVTNGVGVQSFVLEDGAVTSRGEYATLPLSLNEPSFTSSQVVTGSASWTEDTSVAASYDWFGITSSADGTKLAAVADRGNIWTSSDSGANWTEITSVGATKRWTDITSSADGTKLAVVVYTGNIWTSTDSGANWTENTTSPGAGKNWTKITSSADGTKLAATVQSGNIWISTDSGANWTEDTTVGETKNWWIITSSSDGTKLAAGVYGGNIWTSTDSGANWTETTVGDGTNNWYGITMSSDGTKMAAVSWGQVDGSGKIWISTDSGATWTMDTTVGSAKNWTKIASSSDGTKLAATAYGGNIWTSTDSGANWTETTVGDGTNNWRGITMSSDGTNLAATVKAGKIWTFITPPGKLEYTFSESLQAGAGGFDITDFQLIEPSGNTVDLSSNDCGIVGGKLVIGTYATGFYPQGNNYAISGVNATHSGTLYYSATPDHNSTHSTAKFHDGNTSTSWLSKNDTYVNGVYAGSVSTATTNAGTINGEYVQIDVGVNSILSHFTYYTQDSHKTYSPSSGSLVGSKDNVTWDVITSFSYDKDNDPNEVTKNISTLAEYRYYRLIFVAVHAGGHVCGVNEWTLFGHVRENYYIGETISDTNYMLVYNKNSTVNKNIIGATNNVAINSFHIDNNLLIGRGGVTNIGQYDGSTSTTLTDTSTYKGEYIQVDIGKNVVINNYAINVKSINGNDNPKSWMLVGSLNNSDWTKIHETFNHTLTQNYTATVTSTKVRYLRLIVNRGGATKHIKISEFKVNGVEILFEGQTYSASLDNGDAYTVFNNSIATNWDTGSSRNYNGVEALATNEPEFSSIGIHTDASGNGRLELTFNANVSSTNINTSNFTVTDLDLSNSEVFIADISDGKIMIEKQAEITGSSFYEDFNDQAFVGDIATADIVAGGRDGTGHAIQGSLTGNGVVTNKLWMVTRPYRAISYWHYQPSGNNHGVSWSTYFDVNDKIQSYIGIYDYNSQYRYHAGGGNVNGKWTKIYIDGVEGTPYAHNTGSWQAYDTWHHIYLEFNVDVPVACFLAKCYNDVMDYGHGGKIDEVRFFSQGIPEAQIIEIANGWNGTYPGATFLNTNYRINYIKDASSNRHIVKEQAGGSWTENTSVGAAKGWYHITSSSDGTKLAVIVLNANIWTSTDSGATWTENTSIGATKQWFAITMSADGTKLAAGVYGENIWTSSNSGTTWTEVVIGDGTNNWKDITMSADGTKLAAGVYGGNIWTSTDSGATWTEDTSIEFTKNWWGITSSSDGTKLAAIAKGEYIYISTDSGANWTVDTTVGGVKDWRGITSSDDFTKLAATAKNGNIWTSTDSGANWTEVIDGGGTGTNYWRQITSSSDGTKLAAAVYNGNIWTLSPPTPIPINNFIIHDGTLISRGTNYGHYRGSTTTTYNTNQTYNGEHINVNTGQQSYITEYELHVPAPDLANTDNNVYPKSWILLGSTNGSDWSKIHEVTDYTGWTTNSSYSEGYKVNYLTEIVNMVAQHYRLIINKTFGKVGHTSVAELLIKGVKHTSETTGLTQVKTASLGTAANAFDNNISTDWNTSATPSYSLIAAAATNEPTFSSIAVNSGKLELTFSENVAVTGALLANDFNITDGGTVIYVTPTVANNKLVLEYLAIPASQIYHESFDNEDVTFHANADIVYVDGIGGSGKAMSTIDQSPSGLQWEQKVSAGNLPADVRAVSFQIKFGTVGDSQMIFDNRDGDGDGDNRALWFHGNALKFWNNTTTNGTASGSGYLATGNMPSIYIDGTLQVYGTNNSSNGAPVGDINFTTLSDGNWHNFYIEYPAGETLPKEFNWLTRFNGSHNLQASIDDLRYYNAPILQANIDSLAAGGNGGLAGSFTHTNLDIGYTKNTTAAQNIVNAAHTSVPVNTFFISNGVEMSRGSTGRGDYRGTTTTTLPDSSTYNGEWIQIDVGQTILMTEIKLVVPNKDAYTNPKSWKLLVSPDNTNWVELLDVSKNTVWDSGFSSASTQFTGFEIGTGLVNQYVGRYFKVIINSIIGPANHVKINEIVIKGVMHTVETDVLTGPYPTLHTATPSSNATTNHTPVTTTTHNADDTVTTTSVETTVDIAATTVTTTTVKTTLNEVVSAVTLNTATPSSNTTTESDTTALATTYSNNDTSVRTVVNKTIDISANTDTTTNLNTLITTTITGFNIVKATGSSFDPNKIYDASGVACPALKSIYEQLMNISGRSQIMQSRDFTSSPMPSVQTITGGFPFIAGDKLVMYIRPKIEFAQATFPEQFTTLVGFGDKSLGSPAVDIALASGSGGGVTGQTYRKSSEFSGTYAVSNLFDGNTGSIWITASDTFNSSTQVVEEYNSGGHLFDDGGSRSLSLNNSLENSHEDFDNENPTGTVGSGVTYVTGHGGTGKALSTIGVSGISPFIQSGLNGSKAVSFWFYGDPTAANMNSTIMFDTRTNSGPNFALNYPDGVDYLHMWTGGGYTGIEGIYINGSLQTIDGAYSANYGSKIGGDNTTKASLSGVWTHIFVNFSPGVTTINDITWLSRYTSGQVCPGWLDDVRWFAGALNDDEITNLSSGGSGNIGRNMINYFGHYAEIEFTESMAAETLKLTPRNGGGGGAGEPVDFRLLVLEDDNDPTWTSVLKVTESEIAVNWNKNGNDWATHEWLIPLSIGQGKYWRLVINKISTGNKVQLAKMELMGGLTSELTGGGDQAAALSIPGLETNVTNVSTTFPALFPGNTTGGNEAEATKFGWVGSANADTLSLETTDEKDTRTMDLHIWKITITL